MDHPARLGSQLFPHLLIQHIPGPKLWSPSTTQMAHCPCPQTDGRCSVFCWCLSVTWSRRLNVWGTSLHFWSRVPVPPSLSLPRQLCVSFLVFASLFPSYSGSLSPHLSVSVPPSCVSPALVPGSLPPIPTSPSPGLSMEAAPGPHPPAGRTLDCR